MYRHFQILSRHRELIRFLVDSRRKSSVYGMVLGRLWYVLNPLAQIVIYYFLVVIVFRARPQEGISPFLLIMLGVLHYSVLPVSIVAAANSIIQRQNLLLQVKIEPLVFVAASFLHSTKDFAISVAIIVVAQLWLGPPLTTTAWLYPVAVLTTLMLCWAGSLLLATLTVFFRDLQYMIQILLRVVMYLSPVLYSVSFVPEAYRTLYLYNPIACLFAIYQFALLRGQPPPTGPIVVLVVFTTALLISAHTIYARLSPRFTKAF